MGTVSGSDESSYRGRIEVVQRSYRGRTKVVVVQSKKVVQAFSRRRSVVVVQAFKSCPYHHHSSIPLVNMSRTLFNTSKRKSCGSWATLFY